jgi:hypothetical protein
LWACPRPRTRGWGSGAVFERVAQTFGRPEVAFGARDGIPADLLAVDLAPPRTPRALRADWLHLPFLNECFGLGYWDPPYDKMYRREAAEIWRTCRQLAILHERVFPSKWFPGGFRQAQIAVTMGPFRRVRTLQVFGRNYTRLEQARLTLD